MSSIFDIFTNKDAEAAAADQIAGLNRGYTSASNAINTGSNDLTNYYTAALQPFLTNYGQAQQGTTQLDNALGLNGGAGNAAATAAAYASNPAYQFQLQQGTQNVLRNAAQTGTLASGATLNALQNQGQGLANSTYQQYVQNLMPFLNQSNVAAGGIANVNTGLGNALNANQGSLANLGWQYNTGTGNAQANAQLAQNQANSNIWGGIGNLIGGAANFAGSGGLTSAIKGLGGLIGNAFIPSFTPSDERLKEDIERVGALDDGTNVYRYRYIWDDPAMTRVGVMAQEVEKTNPDAVIEIGGVKAVDYGRATDVAATLAKFMDDSNVVPFAPKAAKSGYAADLERFLDEAA